MSCSPLALTLLAAAVVGGNTGTDGGGRPLSLRQAIEGAVKGNVDLRREGVALRTTEANIVAALGLFDVVLESDGTYTRRVTPPAGTNINFANTDSLVFDL